jgi:thioesterase-3
MGEVLLIETAVRKIGSRSGVIHQVVKLKGTDTVIADADVTFVIFSEASGGAIALDGELRNQFDKLPHWPQAK